MLSDLKMSRWHLRSAVGTMVPLVISRSHRRRGTNLRALGGARCSEASRTCDQIHRLCGGSNTAATLPAAILHAHIQTRHITRLPARTSPPTHTTLPHQPDRLCVALIQATMVCKRTTRPLLRSCHPCRRAPSRRRQALALRSRPPKAVSAFCVSSLCAVCTHRHQSVTHEPQSTGV